MSQAGPPTTSRYSLRDRPANDRRRKRSDDTLDGDTDVCQAWQEGKCTKGRECRSRHGKYRRTDNHRLTTEHVPVNDEEATNQVVEAVERFIILDNNLVAYGPGLEIRNIIPGYDLSQIILQLPIDTTKDDIEGLFLQQGLASIDFHVLKIEGDHHPEKSALRATVVTKTQHGRRKVAEGLRKKGIDLVQLRRSAIWTANPALTVTWDSTATTTTTTTGRGQRRVTRSSGNPSVAFETVYQTLSDSRGAQMKSCYLFNVDSTSEEALTLEFDTWEHAEATARAIEEIDVPSLECIVHKPFQYSIRIPIAQYEAQKKQWLALIKKKKTCVKVIGEKYVTIKVEGKDRKFISGLKMKLENLARGEVLDETYWHPSFASAGDSATFLRSVTERTSVHIRTDRASQALRLYGEPRRVNQARSMIQEEVQEREKLITKTRLTGASVAFFKGGGFGKLQELVGEDNVNLKVTPKTATIMVKGGEEATHHFQRLLGESSTSTTVGGAGTDSKPTCPVCFDEASYPERLACGHAYCPGCLNNLLTAVVDSRKFPILCIGDEVTCNVPISLAFIRQFLPPHTFRRLLETAFVTYLEQNPTQVQYCGTSGCEQTFRRQASGASGSSSSKAAVISCPSCFGRTCSSCAAEHNNMSCKEYLRRKEAELQESLLVGLARAKDYRRCPRCKILVEKNGGCDSMYCRCNRSMYWGDFMAV